MERIALGLDMKKGSVSIHGDDVTLMLKNGFESNKSIGDLKAFYCLMVGSDVQGNDSTCYLLQFDEELWLIPELTVGAADFRLWFDRLINENKGVVATLDYLPFSWRTVMVILSGLEANLKILKSSAFEKIRNKISIVGDMTIEEAF